MDSHNLFFVLDVNVPNLTFNQGIKIASAQDGLIFPSLAVDSQGNVAVTANGVSSSHAASVYEWHRLAADPAGTVHGPNVLTTGSGTTAVRVVPLVGELIRRRRKTVGTEPGCGPYRNTPTARHLAIGLPVWSDSRSGRCRKLVSLTAALLFGNSAARPHAGSVVQPNLS